MVVLTKEEQQRKALQEIEDILKGIDVLLKKATDIADEHGVYFTFDGPSYGMGGSYQPHSDDDWESSSCYGEDEYETGTWYASSQSC